MFSVCSAVFMRQYFVAGLIVSVYTGTVFPVRVVISLFLSAFPILDKSARQGTSNNLSHPKIAAPGEVLSTV